MLIFDQAHAGWKFLAAATAFVLALSPSAFAQPRLSVSIEVQSTTLQTGEPVRGRFIVEASGIPTGETGHIAHVLAAFGKTPRSAPIYDDGSMDVFGAGDIFSLPMDVGTTPTEVLKALRSNPESVIRQYQAAIPKDGEYSVPIDQAGPLVPIIRAADGPVAKGIIRLGCLVLLDSLDSPTSPSWDTTPLLVVPVAPKLLIRHAGPPPGETPRAGSPFVVSLASTIEGLPPDPSARVDVRTAAELKEITPARRTPHSSSSSSHMSVSGGPGALELEKRWKVTVPRPGRYEIRFHLSAPSFRPAAKTIVITVPGSTAGAAKPAAPAPSPIWRLARTEDDPDKKEGFALYGGTLTGVSSSGFTANHDKIAEVSGGYAPNAVLKASVAGSIPSRLKKGDRITLAISMSAAKLGRDKCAGGREPTMMASASIGATKHFRITASPHSSGIVFPDGHDGITTCVGGYFGKWFARDSRTYTLEVVDASLAGPMAIYPYFPGVGVIGRHVFEPERAASGGGSSATAATAAAKPGMHEEEGHDPLQAVLEPSSIVAPPGNGLSTLCTVLIKNHRPNFTLVEVEFDTTNAWGALRLYPRIKIEGRGSRLTADMTKSNDGWFHWNLNVLAELAAAPGVYAVPITIRQAGHGRVVRWLTIRVPARFSRN